MNLRVDLILPAEQRSGSRITLAGLGRVASVTVPLILLVLASSAAMRSRALHRDLDRVSAEWQQTEPRFKAALHLKEEILRRRAVLNEIEAWRKARVTWHQQLSAMQEIVPAEIQLTELKIDDMIQTVSNKPVRVFKLQLRGRTGGPESEQHVSRLRSALADDPRFNGAIAAADIPPGSFVQDPSPTAAKSDRLFQIVCKYREVELQ